jgi:dienelactone hydrolase
MKYFLAIVLIFLVAPGAQAKLVTRQVEYQQDGAVLEGYLAYDDATAGKRPGVLVVHEWWGLNDYIKKRTEQLAGVGYLAFAADMYGKGVVTKDPQEAAKLAGQLRGNLPRLRQRAQAALAVLAHQPLADPKRLAAIGFCFGGTTVLELAYSGAALAGVVSFHGGLPLPEPQDLARIQAKILVLHGADDPLVPARDVSAFQEAMRKSGADWQMSLYGGAVHSFTNPAAGRDKSKGVAYDPKAAARAWQAMEVFFQEIFSGPPKVKGEQ